MVQRTLTKKYALNDTARALEYYYDNDGGFAVAGITVDEDSYDNGTFIDRDYDVRLLPQISILLENLGPDAVKYTILSTTKNYSDMATDLIDTDFSEIDKAETSIAPGSQATGSVEVTGGPSTAATGTLTLTSATALVASTGTITCASVLAIAKATGTVTCAAVEALDTVTVNGLVYTAVAGIKADNTEFSIDTSNDATATDLADSITNDTRIPITVPSIDQTATATTNAVTITASVGGTGGNAIDLTSSTGVRLAVSGAFLTGGAAADIVTANGLVYTAVAGIKANNTEFSIDTSNDATATDLAASITADTRTGTLNDVTATATTNVVTCTQTVAGAGGNATTLVSSNGTRLAVSGATFTGGTNADVATVNGLTYTGVTGVKSNNTQFSVDTSDNAAATDLALSITNDSRTGITVPTVDCIASAGTNVVTVSGTINSGADGNAVGISGTANIAASGALLINGVTSTINSIDVGGIELLATPVRWVTSATLTAVAIAAAINALTTNPNYSAANVNGVVTITQVQAGPSTAVVTSTVTVMTKTDVNFTGGAKGVSDVTNITNTTPQRTAIRIRGKTSANATVGKIRGDVKFKNA